MGMASPSVCVRASQTLNPVCRQLQLTPHHHNNLLRNDHQLDDQELAALNVPTCIYQVGSVKEKQHDQQKLQSSPEQLVCGHADSVCDEDDEDDDFFSIIKDNENDDYESSDDQENDGNCEFPFEKSLTEPNGINKPQHLSHVDHVQAMVYMPESNFRENQVLKSRQSLSNIQPLAATRRDRKCDWLTMPQKDFTCIEICSVIYVLMTFYCE